MENLNSLDQSLSRPKSVTPTTDLEVELSARESMAELVVTPLQSLVDEQMNINVRGLSPGQPITLTAKLTGDSKEQFESYGHFIADEAGRVCVAEHPCVSGTYTGVDSMGLLWSMKLLPGQRKGQRLSKKDVTKPYCVHLQLFDGHVEDFVNTNEDLQSITSVTFEKCCMANGVRIIPVREGRVRGTLFLPPGKGPFPGKLKARYKRYLVPTFHTNYIFCFSSETHVT